MTRNRILLAAAILAAFTAAVHTIGGTLEIHAPLLAAPLPESLILLMYACWHLVTVTLVLSAVALYWTSCGNRVVTNYALPIFVGVMWSLFGLVFILVALYFAGFKALVMLPQWTLLIPIGMLSLFGGCSAMQSKRA